LDNSSFARRLKKALDDAGLIATQLARLCSIDKSVISQYLSGKYQPKYDRTVLIARHLGCSPEWLAGEDVPQYPLITAEGEFGFVPVLDIRALDVDDLFRPDSVIRQEKAEAIYCDGSHYILIADDDSMEPDIMKGDHVLCVCQDCLEDGQTGVFLLEDGQAIIRTQQTSADGLVLVPSCRYYSRRTAGQLGVTRILGRVVRTTRYW